MWRILSKTSTNDVWEEGDEEGAHLLSALQHLHAKLLASQPEFTEEDVAIMTYPAPSESPAQSPALSPRDLDTEQETRCGMPLSASGGETSNKHCTLTSDACSSRGGSISPSSSQNTLSSQSTVTDLDECMMCGQFLTVVKRFDAKAVLRNRKAAADALKLVNHGYALIWRDTGYLSKAKLRGRFNATRCTTPATGDVVRGSEALISMKLQDRIAALSSSSVRTHRPPEKFIKLMGSCVESLLVYANESSSLRNIVASNTTLLWMLCFVCVEARKLEATPDGQSWRDVDAELNEFVSHWKTFPVTLPILETLQECYLLEFLLDVALPPTVCSTKYAGIEMALAGKKDRLLMDIVSGRAGTDVLTKGLSLRGLAALVSMFMFAEPKLRARALDKMTGEGLVMILRDEMCGASREIVYADSQKNDNRQTSPSRTNNSSSFFLRSFTPWLRTSLGFSQSQIISVSKERGLFDMQESVAQRLGYCVDVLQCLTAPNLVREMDVDKNTKGVVRATAWASQTEDLRGICACLMRFSFTRLYGFSLLHLHPLRDQAMNCLRQIANHSAALYGVVVEAVDDLFDEYNRTRETACGDCRVSLLPLLVDLLLLKQHAEANRDRVRRWFSWLAESLVPKAFDTPVVVCDTNNGRGARRSSPPNGSAKTSNMRREAPMLARNLRRDEILSLSPYFCFATRLVSETTWRHGAEPFLARIALLAYNVLLTQARRPNLIFGQASACYDVVAPLLETPHGVMPGESVEISRGLLATPTRQSRKAPGRSSSPSSRGKKRGRADSKSPTDGRNSGEISDVEVFISSPSRSPLFLEAYSSSACDSEERKESYEFPCLDASPSSGITVSSWRRRLSLSTFLAVAGECHRN